MLRLTALQDSYCIFSSIFFSISALHVSSYHVVRKTGCFSSSLEGGLSWGWSSKHRRVTSFKPGDRCVGIDGAVVALAILNIRARWLECFSAFQGGLAQAISMTTQPTLHTSQLLPYCWPLRTSGAINAIVPNNCPWNSPAPVPFDANLAAAPKSAILNLWPVLSISKLAPVNSTIKILLVGFLLKAKGWTDTWYFSSLTSKLWNRLTFPTPVSRKSKNQGYGLITSLFCYAWMILHTAWGCLRDFKKQSNFQSRANTRDSGTMPGDGIMEENGDVKPQRLSLPVAPHEI